MYPPMTAQAAVSRGALDGFVVEAGLSASGSALAWLGRLAGRDHDERVLAEVLLRVVRWHHHVAARCLGRQLTLELGDACHVIVQALFVG